MIHEVFGVDSQAELKRTQKLVYSLVDDITGKVLNSTIDYVDKLVKE
jgi:hypothetical protein